MTAGTYRFDRFILRPADRQLSRDDAPVEINGRYFDALTLLVREGGRLVTKDRFLDEVWRGVPVTDEALTQCIRTLRRQLGDDATAPRFIETVPKHGYRFIAPVESLTLPAEPLTRQPISRDILLMSLAGALGGALAGAIGGLVYGFVAASQPQVGAVSVLLVLLCVTTFIAFVGAAGVSLGINVVGTTRFDSIQRMIAGGSLGGLIVGAVVKLLGLDAFDLLFGRAPGDITGPFEGVLLGGAVGLGIWLASRRRSLRRAMPIAALPGLVAGAVIPLLGGRLMGGSLDLLANSYPASRLSLDAIGALVGESEFGELSHILTGALEGALFAACIAGAMLQARRSLDR